MNALTDLKAIVIYILAGFVLVLGLSTWQYRSMFRAADFALTTQNAAIKARNEEAKNTLLRLTVERDALQLLLNTRAAAQRKTDEKAVAQIDADDKLQRAAPVRVRVHDCTRDAGSGGGVTSSQVAPAAQAGAGDAGSASGVLSEAGARRLADALNEIEIMSAAFASCKADGVGVRGGHSPLP
jgi:hypothetical protein